MITARYIRFAIVAIAAFSAACTVKNTDAPPLSGPSELGLSLSMFASPPTLSQDGASQAQIVVQAFDANGQPAKNVLLRAEITVNGSTSDFGSLSARTVVTDNNGRATLVYTAPPAPLVSIDTNAKVSIQLTPTSTDASSAFPRFVDIRLVPPGVILGTNGPKAAFTVPATAPAAFVAATFDASSSTPGPGGVIVSYVWDFGDGSKGAGNPGVHAFAEGDYVVTLTVMDNNGATGSSSRALSVGAGKVPTAAFTTSPSAGVVTGQQVFFNGSTSTAGVGRTLVKYEWDFGTGSTASGVTASKAFDAAASYTITLKVTDDVGQFSVKTGTLIVAANGNSVATARFTWSPNPAPTNQPVTFDASSSSTTAGTIVRYDWNFNDGSNPIISTSSPTIQHTFSQQAGPSGYTVTLTVTDSNGSTNSKPQQVVVQ